jgi:hypothetical protein
MLESNWRSGANLWVKEIMQKVRGGRIEENKYMKTNLQCTKRREQA